MRLNRPADIHGDADSQHIARVLEATKYRRHRLNRIRRVMQYLVGLVTAVLVINAVIGEGGLLSTLRARADQLRLEKAIKDLRQKNATLREMVSGLSKDPTALERIAREELGLLAPGEQLMIVADVVRQATPDH